MRSCRSGIAILLLLGVAHCAGAPTAPSAVREHVIRPSEANSAVTTFDEPHYVWVPITPTPTGRRLMPLLPGTGGHPANVQLIGRVAAQQGYSVVALAYPDDLAVVAACANDPAPNCMALVREEIILGTSLSPHVAVDPANSITARLRDLRQLLASKFPEKGWADFLENGELRWSAIAVGGLSQGGGHAAYIAKIRSVPRVVMFGAPADGYDGAPAPWMTLGATPAANYYGFRHERDPFTSITPNWLALGLDQFGAAIRVEGRRVVRWFTHAHHWPATRDGHLRGRASQRLRRHRDTEIVQRNPDIRERVALPARRPLKRSADRLPRVSPAEE